MENTPEPKKTRPQWLVPVIVGVVTLFIGVGIGMSNQGGDPVTAADVSPTPTGLTGGGMSLEPPEPVEEEPIYDELKPRDLELTLRTIESDCFGSAGGLETVRISAGIDGTVADNLDPELSWDITYKIMGDEDGPVIGTFTLYPDGQYDVNDEVIATPTCSDAGIRIKVEAVQGY